MRTQSAFEILSLGLLVTAAKRDFGLNCAMRRSHNPNWNRLARFLAAGYLQKALSVKSNNRI